MPHGFLFIKKIISSHKRFDLMHKSVLHLSLFLCTTFYNIKDPEIFRIIDTLAPNYNDQISQQCDRRAEQLSAICEMSQSWSRRRLGGALIESRQRWENTEKVDIFVLLPRTRSLTWGSPRLIRNNNNIYISIVKLGWRTEVYVIIMKQLREP